MSAEGPSVNSAGRPEPRRLFVYNGGFLTQPRVRRILELSGYKVTLGKPGQDDLVGVWGRSPTSHRGEAVAERQDTPLVRVEDAFLRSLFPNRHSAAPPIGLLIDETGVHFDPATPSDLETLLATHPLDDAALLDRARGAIARMQEEELTKYTACDPDLDAPEPGYVLVIDQTRGDASITASGADQNRFQEMLYWAQEDHPGARILIKTHPETVLGQRPGYFDESSGSDHVHLLTENISPWRLFEGAIAVYTVSSQMGFEAIFAGHKPVLFGQPFYAGWGLTDDRFPIARRQRNLSRAQLFAGAMLLYPRWYDPYRDRLGSFEDAAEALAAETRAWREDRKGYLAAHIRLWKRAAIKAQFGRHGPVTFRDTPPQQADRPVMVWASKAEPDDAWTGAIRLEDGFLRSRGLGADLVPALSLVRDDLGIYYDPGRPSRLEKLIVARRTLRPDQSRRAANLIRALSSSGLSKYNVGDAPPPLPDGHRVLVPGQVEDDASILKGTGNVSTNDALLKTARAAHPDAVLIYKPHPDVEAGLRKGVLENTGLADVVVTHTDAGALLAQVQEVWTMTSLLGFEALLRGVRVTTLGAPFYAGWGLTTDLGNVPPRRRHDVSLETLVHAALIDYPRYWDPVTRLPCTVEVIVERLAHGYAPRTGPAIRALSKLQGIFAGFAPLWR